MPIQRLMLMHTALATSMLLMVAPTLAQEDEDEFLIEEIIVTAQKREQSVVDVPINITAYRGEFLDRIGVSEFDELSDFTPGFIVQEQSPNNPGFVIRGVTSDDGTSQIAPRVTIYENGFDVSRSRGSQFELYDIDRTEVIKGPQATLFGTASLVGAVSITTKRPEEGFSAGAVAGYGNFNFVKAGGYVNYGTDTWGVRVATQYRRRDGFIRNIAGEPGSQTPDGPDIEDLNGLEIFAIRPTITFTPNDKFDATFILNYQQEDPPGTAFKSGVLPPTGGTTDPNSFAELAGIPNSIEVFGADLGLDRRRYSANLTMNYDLTEKITLTSVSGYLNFDSVEVFDADGSAAPFLEFVEDATGEVFSQEFRATYTADKLNAFIGVNWYHEEGTQSVPFATDEGVFVACFDVEALAGLPDVPCIGAGGAVGSIAPILEGVGALPPGTPLTYVANFFTDTGNQDTYSIFLDGSYEITDKLEVTGGIRYIYENRESGQSTDLPPSVLGLASGVLGSFIANSDGIEVVDSEDFDAVVGRFNLLYRFTDQINGYITVGRGRRSPVVDVNTGFDAGGALIADTSIIAPEIVWNYEGGVKGRFFDGLLDASLSVFFQDYSDFQTTLLDINGLGLPITAGDSENIGVEIEFYIRPFEGLDIFGNYAFTEGEIDGEGDLEGAPFRLQAEHTAAAGILYDREIFNDYRVFATATANFRSEVFFEEATTVIAGLTIGESSVTEVDLSAGFGAADQSWSIKGYVTNLNNQSFVIDGGNTGGAFGIPTFIAGAPRFFGVELEYNY